MNAEKVLQLLQASSCFGGDVCTMLPCACAETIAARIEVLEAALRSIRDDEKNCANYCRRQADKALKTSARAALDEDPEK